MTLLYLLYTRVCILIRTTENGIVHFLASKRTMFKPRCSSPALPMQRTEGPLRIFFAAWCLTSLALSACYTGKLTSLLTDVSSPPPFGSLADMLDVGDLRWGTLGGGKFLTSLRVCSDFFFFFFFFFFTLLRKIVTIFLGVKEKACSMLYFLTGCLVAS